MDGEFRGMNLTHHEDMGDDVVIAEFRVRSAAMITQVQDHMNTRLENDLHGTIPVLKAMAVAFEPSSWPASDVAEFAAYGNEAINIIALHFDVMLHRMGCNIGILMREWLQLKVFVSARVNGIRGADHMRNLWAQLFNDAQLQQTYGNILMLVEISLVVALSSSVCERGFSTIKRVKSDWRAGLTTEMLDNLLMICIEGPDFEAYDAARAFNRWFNGGQRRRRIAQADDEI